MAMFFSYTTSSKGLSSQGILSNTYLKMLSNQGIQFFESMDLHGRLREEPENNHTEYKTSLTDFDRLP